MLPSFETFLAQQKLKKYTFPEPTEVEKWGYFIMTAKAVGPRGGETYLTRSYWNRANKAAVALRLRGELEKKLLRKLTK